MRQRYQSVVLRFHDKKTCALGHENDRNLSFIEVIINREVGPG